MQTDTVGLPKSEAVESTSESGEASTEGDLASDRTTARAADAALMDLQFIGSSAGQRDADASLAPGGIDRRRVRQEPPASALGGLHDSYAHVPVVSASVESAGQDAASGAEPAHPLDTPGFNVNQRSIVDRDELPPLATRAAPKSADGGDGEWRETAPPFSNSLITNDSVATDE